MKKVYKIGSQLNEDGDLEITLLIDNEQCILVLDSDFIVESSQKVKWKQCEKYYKNKEENE